MNSNKKSWLMLCLLCLTILFSAKTYGENNLPQMEKFYIQPSQLYIVPEGIFLINEEGNLERLEGIISDKYGILAGRWAYKCKYCNSLLDEEGICHNQVCPSYTKKRK